MSNELDDLFSEISQTVLVFIGKEIKDDPEEESKTTTTFNPVPIQAIVTDLTSEQMKWKGFGIETGAGKELLMESKHKTLIQQSQKIVIDNIEYLGWRDNFGQTQIRTDGNYLRIYIYRKS